MYKLLRFNMDMILACIIKENEGVVLGDFGIKARELFENGDIAESNYFSFLENLGINLEELERNGK